jgi:mono/diheme cytochrome c family protein
MMMKVVVLSAAVLMAAASGLRAQQAQQAKMGAELYASTCQSCHGAAGTPSPAMARAMAGIPNFADSTTMAAVADSTLRNAIADGKGRMMAAYKSRLTPAQIASLVTYIRSLSRH